MEMFFEFSKQVLNGKEDIYVTANWELENRPYKKFLSIDISVSTLQW